MSDQDKTKEELIKEISEARSVIADLYSEMSRQRKVVESLRGDVEKYHIHFSLANDIMFSYDDQFRVLSVSPNVERILGYRPEELIGGTFQSLNVLNPDYMELAIKNALKVLSGETVYASIYEFIAKDGTRKFGEVSGVPVIQDGRFAGSVTVARDVTSRMEMEKTLQQSEERYRITLQTMPEAVSITRMDDAVYIYNNEAFSRITGYSPHEAIGKTPLDLDLPLSTDDFIRCMEFTRGNIPVDSLELQFRRKDGSIIDTLLSARPVLYGKEQCMLMVMADVTDLKRIEEEKRSLELQSQKMESIGTLAGGIAHDFNNILTTIIGYTKMTMKDIKDSKKAGKDLDAISSDLKEVRNAALRARDLVNHILAFSRHGERKFEPIELGSTIRESLLKLRPTLPANIKIRENLAASNLIMGDATQVHQVITNLCSNAIHAMKEKGGVIDVGVSRIEVSANEGNTNIDVSSGAYLKLTVKDTGCGMTKKVIARIFDPYFTTRFSGHGAGLGLSVVHGILKSHGGAISCKSSFGEGTTFDIYLPEYIPASDAAVAAREKTSPTGGKRILDLDAGPSRKALADGISDGAGISARTKNKQA